ncbi:MAG: NAD(P)-dependent oxidoreductase, partial [Rhodobacteraceae bacterium]|nr:NAD(P)-dependent oxidoreductase [Paracoccaceae bacterium]
MAPNRMLQFVTVPREMPDKREADLRAHDFDEIYREFADERAASQAGRC